jgi:hypothetical protein
MHPRQHRDMRVQSGSQRAHRHPRGQLGQRRARTTRTRQAMAAPLAHLRHDQRQISLLIADGLTDSLLSAAEPVPAPTDSRQTVHRAAAQLIRLGRRPIRPLMTGLRPLSAAHAARAATASSHAHAPARDAANASTADQTTARLSSCATSDLAGAQAPRRSSSPINNSRAGCPGGPPT